jgi:UDP-N-acetylglucosamine 2-epimerase (non-hydrolysing)
VKVLHVVGTRPNFMKIAPLMAALDGYRGVEQRLVHTAQHYDRGMSGVFFEEMDLPHPDHFLGVGSGTHGAQAAKVIVGVEQVVTDDRPDVVVVPGDVNSTMGAAIAAAKLQVPVAHLEAGLRSYDRTMPEEHNRVIADHLAELLLTPSLDADANLAAEGIPTERVRFVGNVMIDSLRRYEGRARELDVPGRELQVQGHLLVTLHRPSLVDHSQRLLEVMQALERVAEERPVVFPVHPRTRSMLDEQGWRGRRVHLLEPQSYVRFLSLMVTASAVLTDSGGIQEETTALGVPCFTLRSTTERPITVSEGTNRVLGTGSEALARFLELLGPARLGPARELERWDGQAAGRAAAALVDRFGDSELVGRKSLERTA